MSTTESIPASATDAHQSDHAEKESEPVEMEVLVEEISIDGMCGVY